MRLSPCPCALLLAAQTLLVAQSAPPLRFLEPVFTQPATLTSDLVYGANLNPWTNQQDTLRLDVWEPAGDTSSKRPVCIYVHGGEWWYGSKTDGPPRLFGQTFTALGYVVLCIDYRLALSQNHGGLGPGVVGEDAKAAVRWARRYATQWRIDPERIAIAGDSCGADAAIVAGYAPWEGSSGNPGHRSDLQAVIDLWGRGTVPVASPRCGLNIVHGTADQAVPFSEAQRLAAEAMQNGVYHELLPIVGGLHAPWFPLDRWLPRVQQFAYEALRLQELAGLDALPGYQAGGNLTLRVVARESTVAGLFVSSRAGVTVLPGIGTLLLDPSEIVPVWTGSLGAGAGTQATRITLPLPGWLAGKNLHWQAAQASGIVVLRLSNGLSTGL